MITLRKARYQARFAAGAADIHAAQSLRFRCFGGDAALGLDQDRFDPVCEHVLVEDSRTGEIVCCFRLMHLNDGGEIEKTYSAQYYELSSLRSYAAPMVEMGRFCIAPGYRDPDILRAAWGAMAEYVDANGVEMLFGCSSFKGVEADRYRDAFALLRENHLAPKRWLPKVKAPKVFRFGRQLKLRKPDLRRAMQGMPPLLRTYLVMGGWVSDHAVVDPVLNTLHVFTGLEIKAIPPTRARLLRAGSS